MSSTVQVKCVYYKDQSEIINEFKVGSTYEFEVDLDGPVYRHPFGGSGPYGHNCVSGSRVLPHGLKFDDITADEDGWWFETLTPPAPGTTDMMIPPEAIDEEINIVRPAHYARYAIEPITFIMANQLPFAVGNVVKYVLRYDAKGGREDLKKARRYIDMILEDMDRREAGDNGGVVPL